MITNIEQLTSQDIGTMSSAEFDAMPFGMIKLDREGVVKSYNSWEAQLARRKASEVIGKNFFTDVAPCTNVAEFRGQLDALCAAGGKSHIFDYDFAFPWGRRRVRVRFVIESTDERWVLVTNVDKVSSTALPIVSAPASGS